MLQDLINDVKAELRERLEYGLRADDDDDNDAYDAITEIADGSVPLYTYDLLQLAVENPFLATDEPELGPAFDGSPTPINIIAANVYEYLEGVLHTEWEAIKEELETADTDD